MNISEVILCRRLFFDGGNRFRIEVDELRTAARVVHLSVVLALVEEGESGRIATIVSDDG
jgi:hypothetical protein